MASTTRPKLKREDYTVAWVCILHTELLSARAMLDETHQLLPTPKDQNSYTLGRMGEHNVVVVKATTAGRGEAATVATNLVRSFPKIRFSLVVGIGGGATNAPNVYGGTDDIRLGDVVVSEPKGDHGMGVFQYNLSGEHEGGYYMGSHLNRPAQILISATGNLRGDHGLGDGSMQTFINEGIAKLQEFGNPHFRFPGREHDRLFRSDYNHQKGQITCDECDHSLTVDRGDRALPSVHYGLVASADVVMKSARVRDRMRQDHNVICFEMEAAGLMNNIPCITIRGISDYADTHKNDRWQPYAAMTAAGYAKDLLRIIPPEEVDGTELAAIFVELKQDITQIKATNDITRRNMILDWITPLHFHKKQRNLLESRFSTGKWLLNSDQFKHWVDGARWRLHCYGLTGTGKTYLCAIIVNHLQKMFPLRPVLYIYLDDDPQAEQTPENLTGSLLKQLIQFDPSCEIPQLVEDHYARYGLEQSPSTEIKREAFETLLEKYERTYLVVDGIENYSKSVCEAVRDYPMYLVTKRQKISVLTTSQNYTERENTIQCNVCLRTDVALYFNCSCEDGQFDVCGECRQEGLRCPESHEGEMQCGEVEVQAEMDELEDYCRHQLNSVIQGPKATNEPMDERLNQAPAFITSSNARYISDKPNLLDIIARRIAELAQGNFLVAKCSIEDFLQNDIAAATDQDLIDNIQVIPYDSLVQHVRKKLESIKCHQSTGRTNRLGQDALGLVYSAREHLTLKMLTHALALQSNTGLIEPCNLDKRVPILVACNGLLSIDRGDEANSWLSFFHHSMWKVLSRIDHEILREAHAVMAKICLTYLKHPDALNHCEKAQDYPFLPYASKYWGEHVKEACLKLEDSAQQDAFQFVHNTYYIKLWTRMVKRTGPPISIPWIHDGVHSLHICAWFGISGFIKRLVHEGDDINIRDRRYNRTPLRYACVQGQIDAVSKLLELEAVPDDATLFDAMFGLPGANLLPNDNENEDNRFKIAQMLLRSERVNINAGIGWRGQTALICAAKRPYLAAVKTLLNEKSIDVDLQDASGRTAIMQAIRASMRRNTVIYGLQGSCHEIVTLLLEHNANPNILDKSGQSALTLAVMLGRANTVKALLRCSQIELKFPNKLLHLASANAHPTVIFLLHDKLSNNSRYSLNSLDEAGCTPLHHACQSASPLARATIEALLQLGADPNISNKQGHTASMLLFALQDKGYADSLALRYPGLNKSPPSVAADIIRDVPALILAKHHGWSPIQHIISRKGANLNFRDPVHGFSLLHQAVMENKTEVVDMILSAGVLSPNCLDIYGRRPLHLSKSRDMAKILLRHGCHIGCMDLSGDTVLASAIRRRVSDVADFLVEAGATVTNNHHEIQHLLAIAEEIGSSKAVEALLNLESGVPDQHRSQALGKVLHGRFWARSTLFKSIPLPLFVWFILGICLVPVASALL
ncbi:Nucleoside phosphorylase [Penicillium paradoxum]|uniref:Nucleoside phosphorylase n=1 Tax=Penicillium paradoxum TaxID=176176 RepID=UPI0025466D93|nr:Nucleoside phosphorylase [Penicillium paradoxum]KAJ5783115.1 Nucleoside phosphorylase [Penicillium paradoxum]